MSLNGWHRGERGIHEKLGHTEDYTIMSLYHGISGDLPEEHAIFYTTRLPFLPIVTLDASGRPWGSVLAGRDGKPGFVSRNRYNVLSVDAKLWVGEPLLRNLEGYTESESTLVAGIGVEYSTRRRNKFAGKVISLEKNGENIHFDVSVSEALGNCPKYITIRDLVPNPDTLPIISYENLNLEQNDRLPEDVISFILESDTVFLGTIYTAPAEEASRYPSHLGMNQRGGRKGFIRVLPSDGRTVVLPDFSGNRFMTSLGNIEADPLASLTFISFTTSSILYLTGTATNHIGTSAHQLMPTHNQNALTTLHVTGYTLVANALPIRQRPGTEPLPSPYSPPVRLLAEESGLGPTKEGATALLTRIEMHSSTLATFTWEPSEKLSIVAGQAAILDFTPLLGAQAYQHMAPSNPASLNDDRVRTWTVSRSSTESFSLTMREKPGGAVTGALFSIARKLQAVRPTLLEDARPLALTVGLVGVSGEFVLPPTPRYGMQKLLWLAGGIGVTPFVAMIRGLDPEAKYNVHLVLSTREPEVLLPLLEEALLSHQHNAGSTFAFDVFSEKDVPDLKNEKGVVLRKHRGRVARALIELDSDVGEKEVYLCGPVAFEEAVLGILGDLGVDKARVRREGFGY
ncbi:hypothetical protein DXG01_006980 [Tephrocybe rancida]|nr:hypothetical protein DXG01_006980 [Tephrocybe rancida]